MIDWDERMLTLIDRVALILDLHFYRGIENFSDGTHYFILFINQKFRFEIALRLIDPSVALPYWDSTLDQPLPDSRHSILWTEQMWGETNTTNGYIINGVFTNWTTTGGTNLLRRYPGRATTLMSNSEVNKIFNATDIINVLAYTSPWPVCS
jgi:hypothetical protein